jgi:uncharacterized protein with PIN domain
MNPAAEAAAEAFDALLATHGEIVTFRGASVLALVNRKTTREREPHGKINFDQSLELSEIQVKVGSVDAKELKSSAEFKDQFGWFHRIHKAPVFLGHAYSMLCSQSQ